MPGNDTVLSGYKVINAALYRPWRAHGDLLIFAMKFAIAHGDNTLPNCRSAAKRGKKTLNRLAGYVLRA